MDTRVTGGEDLGSKGQKSRSLRRKNLKIIFAHISCKVDKFSPTKTEMIVGSLCRIYFTSENAYFAIL